MQFQKLLSYLRTSCYLFFGCTFCFISLYVTAQQANTVQIIPMPNSVQLTASAFKPNAQTKLVLSKSWDNPSRSAFLQQQLRYFSGVDVQASDSASAGTNTIYLLQTTNSVLGSEGYTLTVSGKAITIQARTFEGTLYGLYSMMQQYNPATNEITGMVLSDTPRFGWRGLMLDVSRHFFDIAYVKRTLDLMAYLKLNVFHMHLTDDQGWRIEIKKYPALTAKGGFRDDLRNEPWTYFQFGVSGTKPVYGGFYTQAQIKDLIAYAAERNITIVPEIDLPGHSWAAMYAYNYLSCNGNVWRKPEDVPFVFAEPLCICKPEAMQFVRDVLGEVMELFPSKYIHIGGDECRHEAWLQYDICKNIMQKENIQTTAALQGWFNQQVEAFVVSKGKNIIGWDEILEGGITPGAAVMSWRGEEGGIQAAKLKHKAVMSPSTHLYLDMMQSPGEKTESFLRILPLEKVYSYEPIPAELNAEEATYIMGVQGNLWTEFVQTPETADKQFFPRAIAIAELGWTQPQLKNMDHFRARLINLFKTLDAKRYAYAVPIPYLNQTSYVIINTLTVQPVFNTTYGKAYYTLDGSDPNLSSTAITGPIQISETATLKMRAILPSGLASKVFEARFTKQEPVKAVPYPSATPRTGLQATYFEGIINTLSDWPKLKLKKSYIETQITIPGFARKDSFALRFEGFIRIPETGVYTFALASDDGSKLTVAGQVVVNHDGTHGATEKTGSIALQKGYHKLTLDYFEALYGETLQLFIEGPSITKQPIPQSLLFR